MLKPGRELDVLIAEKVMGWQVETGIEPYIVIKGKVDVALRDWSPSTDIAAAWEVVEEFAKRGFYVQISYGSNERGRPVKSFVEVKGWVGVTPGEKPNDKCHYLSCHGFGDTASHAICLAALKAVGYEA